MTLRVRTGLAGEPLRNLRIIALGAALCALVLKVYMATTTGGVDDVWLFGKFAEAIHRHGPYMVYGKPIPNVQLPYNHPPLTGLMLQVFYDLQAQGAQFQLLIRLPAILADLVTTLLVFEIVRSRRPLWEAAVAAVTVAVSPILFVISGYHGNTDPVFVMFTLLSLYLLLARWMPLLSGALAGACFAVGLNIKIVPIIALPLLMLIAWRTGIRRLIAFLAASGGIMVALWLPVLWRNWSAFKAGVLDYGGVSTAHGWGLPRIAFWLGVPDQVLDTVQVRGRLISVVVAVVIPLLWAWRRPDRSVPAVGLTFVVFLLLNQSIAMQYLAWCAAPVFLGEIWSAVTYSAIGGMLALKVYDSWNHAYPWNWRPGITWSHELTPPQIVYAAITWGVLLIAAIRCFSAGTAPVASTGSGPAPHTDDPPDGRGDREPTEPSADSLDSCQSKSHDRSGPEVPGRSTPTTVGPQSWSE